MNKRVFREFMKKEVIQKSIIFTSAFGISITKWYGANENDKFPYRIHFYHKQNYVGYIDAEVMQLGDSLYSLNHFPFEFFTPIGIMKGIFDSYQDLFSYDIEERNNSFDKIEGLFKIHSFQENSLKDYIISSYTKLESQNNPLLHVSFNNCVDQAEFAVESSQHFREEVKYETNSFPRFVHYNYSGRNQKEKLSEIIFTKDDNSKLLTANYDFLTTNNHQDVIESTQSNHYMPIWRMIREVDLKKVWKELENNDPRLIEFLNEVRAEMIIYSKNSKPISLYDRMATLSFSHQQYQNSFNLTQAKKEKLGLENNPVLKKMREYKR